MFEKHRAKEAAKAYEQALAAWQAQRDGYAALVQLAEGFPGAGADGLLLKPGEAVFFTVTGAALVEERRGPGQWKGHSQGLSIPVAAIHGRSIRYRVGQTRGHMVQGAPVSTAVDRGTVYITDQRVIFQGATATRECLFAKLIGFQHSDEDGSTTFSVSNRQKPMTVHYGAELSGAFDFRLDLAIAHFRGTVGELAGRLRKELAEIDAARPVSPPA